LPRAPLPPPLFPYTTLFRSEPDAEQADEKGCQHHHIIASFERDGDALDIGVPPGDELLPVNGPQRIAFHAADFAELLRGQGQKGDRKSTRLNSSHVKISYAV